MDKCFSFNSNTNIFVNENLTLMNDYVAFNCWGLKREGLIFACFTIEGIVHIKILFLGKPFKIYCRNILHEMFPEFNFNDTNRDEGGPIKIVNST